MNIRQKATHGGKREGAGRKPEALSQAQVKKMLRRAKRWAKKSGKDIDDVLLAVIYNDKKYLEDDDITIRDRLAAIKLFKDKTMAPITEGGIVDRNLGPQTYLPKEKPDNVTPLKLVENTQQVE